MDNPTLNTLDQEILSNLAVDTLKWIRGVLKQYGIKIHSSSLAVMANSLLHGNKGYFSGHCSFLYRGRVLGGHLQASCESIGDPKVGGLQKFTASISVVDQWVFRRLTLDMWSTTGAECPAAYPVDIHGDELPKGPQLNFAAHEVLRGEVPLV